MFRFKYIRKVPIVKLIFGFSLFLFSIILLMDSVKSLVITGIAIYFMLTDGIEFDFKNKKFRPLKSVLGLDFGRWKDLPDIEFVSVFKTNENTALRSRSAEAMVKKEVIKLNLFYDTNKKIEAYTTEDRTEAFDKAKELAKILDISVFDATQSNTKWL
jgi:hypothetical protein